MKEKLKIAIGTEAFPPTIDGISIVAKCYADIINNGLGEATIVTPKNPNQEDYKYPYEIYRYKSLFTFGEGYPVGWPFKKQFALDVIDKEFDILHSHCPIATSYFYRRINRIERIPQVLTYHTKYEYDIDSRVPFRLIKNRAYGMLLNNMNCADEVWVTSEGTVESLRHFGYEGDYVVMPNGCDLPKVVATQNDKMMMRRRHNISNDTPVFIFVGRMMWYKNIKLILEALKILKDNDFDFRMIMIGMGPEENAIKKFGRRIGVDDKIIYTGQLLDRVEIQRYYLCADLLVFPSVFDTNGLVVREAASAQTPSILVEGSCAAERIQDGVNGFLCDENAISIAAKIKSVIGNRDLIRRVGENAQDNIYISWEQSITNAYERYYVVIDKFKSKPKSEYQY